MAFFTVSSFAKTTRVRRGQSDDVQPHLAKARDTVAKALEANGLTVVADEYNPSSMEFSTADDVVGLTFKEDGIDVTVNGKPVDFRMSGVEAQQAGDDPNLIKCILTAVNIFGLQLDICEFQNVGLDLLCIPEATFDFALNVLRCVGTIGD
jgi:hypothetical protein